MKPFVTRFESCIDIKQIRLCTNTIEPLLNDLLASKNFGEGLDGGFLFVIRLLDDKLKATNYYKPVAKY